MGEVTANTIHLMKKQFLMRQLQNRQITQEEYDAKITPLEDEIAKNLKQHLDECAEKLRQDCLNVRSSVFGDGDIKKKTSKLMIEFLRQWFTPSEIKGICRQGYKAMREECGGADD